MKVSSKVDFEIYLLTLGVSILLDLSSPDADCAESNETDQQPR